MADGANLELKFTGSLDESVRHAFTAITKLLTGIDKAMGSLNSSMNVLVKSNSALVSGLDKLSENTGRATASTEKQADAFEKVKTKSIHWLRAFKNMTAGVQEGTRAYGDIIRALQKTEKQWNNEVKAIEKINSEIRKLYKELTGIEDKLNSGASPKGDSTLLKRRAEEIKSQIAVLEEIKRNKNAFIESFDYENVAAKHLDKIKRSASATAKEIQKFGREAQWAQDIAANLARTTGDGTEYQRQQFASLRKYLRQHARDVTALDGRIAVARKALAETTDETARVTLQNSIDDLRRQRDALTSRVTGPDAMRYFQEYASGQDQIFDKWQKIGRTLPWVNDYQEKIRKTTVAGSVEQQASLQKLADAHKAYASAEEKYKNRLNILNKEMEGKSGKELDDVKSRINTLNSIWGNFTRNFTTQALDNMSSWNAELNKFSDIFKKLPTGNAGFNVQAAKLTDMFSTQKIGINEYISRMQSLITSYNLLDKEQRKLIETGKLSQKELDILTSKQTAAGAAAYQTAAGMRQYLNERMGRTAGFVSEQIGRMANSLKSMVRYAFASSIGYAFIGSFDSIIKSVAEFDQSLKNLQAITNATDTEIGLLGDEIKKVAVETKYGLKEVADGAVIIGQAGFSATETISILGSAMNLAQGSMSTVSASADLLTTVIAAFNLNASDAATVADNMAAAMNYSKLDIDKLRVAFNYVGPVAMDAGLSLNEMSAALMVLANNGMKASTIGTSLRNVFSQIASPSTALKSAFENDTEALAKLQDKSTSIVEKFEILNRVLGTSSNLYELFGLRAAGTVSILMKYPGQLQEMVNGLYTLGDAERMAEKQMEGLANRMKNFKAAMEVAAVTISERPAGALSNVVKWMTDLVSGITSVMDSSFGDAVAYVLSFGTAIGTVSLAVKLLATVFGTTLPKALAIATASLGAKLTATVADTAATTANTVATEANTAANVANAASDTASVTANTADTAATVADTAATTANTAATTANTAANVANAASVGKSAKAIRLVSTALGFLSNHPAILVISALAATIGVVTAAVSAFREEEDIEYKTSAKWIKQKQEQLGLLRTAINANRNLKENEEAIRMSNNIYVATKVPQIATALLDIPDKEETQKILEQEFAIIKNQIVEVADKTIVDAINDLQGSANERKRIQDTFKERLAGAITVDLDTLGIEDTDDIIEQALGNSYEISLEDQKLVLSGYQDAMAEAAKATQDAYARIRHAVSTTSETVAHDVDELIRKHGSAKAALDTLVLPISGMSGSTIDVPSVEVTSSDVYEALMTQHLAELETQLDSLEEEYGYVNEAYRENLRLQVESSINNYKLARSVVDATSALKELPSVLNEIGLDGTTLVNMYKDVDKGMYLLATAAQRLKKAREDIAEKGLVGEAKIQAEKQALDTFYDTLGKGIDTSYKRETAWIEATRKAAIVANREKLESTTEAKRKEHEINIEFYRREQEEAEKSIEKQLQIMMKEAGIQGQLSPEELKIVLNMDLEQLQSVFAKYPGLEDLLKTPTLLGTIQRRIDIGVKMSNEEDQLTGKVDPVTGLRHKISAIVNENAAKNAQAELAYERGTISYNELEAARLANTRRELDERAKLLKTIKSGLSVKDGGIIDETTPEYARYYKEYTDYIKDTAEYERNVRKNITEQAIRSITQLEEDEIAAINARETVLRTSSMNEMDRQEQLLALELEKLQVEQKSIDAQYHATSADLEKREIGLRLQEKNLEIDEKRKELSDAIAKNREKYIEQEYKYGLQTKQAYRRYIEKQQREGTMNPYDAQKELWRTSDNPYEGYLLGLTEIADATKTMNEYISEGVANFRDEWHSAMDEFVESWWDGTASASEIFGDFVNNIAMDWQKRILKMYSDRMFEGFAKTFLSDSMQGIFGSYGGGRASNVTTDDGLSNPTATATPAVAVGNNLALNLSSVFQNVQSVVNANTTRMANDVATMSQQSTTSIINMSNGAANLWQYLGNGFTGLWNNISSGLSGVLASLTFATTASSGGSFWERWLGNSIGMGFQLYSMGGSGGSSGFSIGSNGTSGSLALSNSFNSTVSSLKNGIKFANGGVLKGLSGFSNSIVTSPTLFTYGEHLKAFAKGAGLMGEVGPEAIMPLTRDGSGRLGVNASGMSPCINNIYIETPEGYTAEQKSRVANDNGGEDIMFTIVKQTAANVAQPGSPMYRAMQNTFGASQVLTSR